MILDEILRLRGEQDDRLDHYRRVAGLMLGIFIPVSGLTFGLMRYDEPVETSDPQLTEGTAEPAAESSDASSQSWPDLPDFELYNDTFAEKGAATQYRSED